MNWKDLYRSLVPHKEGEDKSKGIRGWRRQESLIDTTSAAQTARHHLRASALIALAVPLVLLAFTTPRALAQGTGEITGTVTDPTGAVVPGASVTLTAISTGVAHTAETNRAGLFDFSGLDVGKYNLSVKMTGFQAYKMNGIVMNVAQTLKEDVPLVTGGENQVVTVEANALQVQAATNEMSTLITGQQMVQLATNGRNVIGLTTLGTGVSTTNPSFNGVTAQGSSFNLSFNGMRPDHNNWLINGGEVYDRGSGGKLDVMPAPDMLSEFQVLSSNYTPDYGISSGGTVTMVMKSGTKNFHGALWEFNRNDAFQAYNYFSKISQPVKRKPELRLNIFGGTIGGPVWIPGVYNRNKDKTYFFVGEEWRRFIQGANPSTQNTVPNADFPTAGQNLTYVPFGGDLNNGQPITKTCPNGASGPGLICVPATSDPAKLALYASNGLTAGAPFPNNTIPAGLLDSNALLFMGTGAIPHPNTGSEQYIASPKQPTYVREDVVRIDQLFTDKLHLLGSWIHDSMSQTIFPTQWSGDSYSTVGDVFSNPSWAAVIKLSQTLSPTLLNETALNVNGNTIDVQPAGIYQQPSGWSAKSFFNGNNALNRLPQVAFSGGPLNTTYSVIYWPWHNSFLDYQVRDDLSKISGRHALKFGFSYMRMDKNQQLQADTEGDYSFNGSAASQNSYVNFLLGFADTYQQLQTQRTGHYINNNYSFYAQDDWHVSPRMTLNLGLRYDLLPHVYDKFNQLGNFNPNAYSATNAQSPDLNDNLNPNGPGFVVVNGESFYLNGIQIAGQNGVPRGLVNNDYKTVQPRVGFAYDIGGNGKTVLRGGTGIFYERVQGNDTYNINTTPPFSYQPKASTVYFSNPNTSYVTGATATTPFKPAGLTNESTYYPNPGTLQFSLGVQREIAPSIVAFIGYVGTTGWTQNDLREINDLNFGSPLASRKAVAQSTTQVLVNGVPTSSSNTSCTTANQGSSCFSPTSDLYRPYHGFSNVRQEENQVNFSYHSLQASMRMEAKHGFSAQFSYTYSHEIDIQSGDITSSNQAGSGGTLSNPYNANYDRGSGLFDRRNIFNANWIYTLQAFRRSGNMLERQVLGGWEIAGTMVAESGVPINPYYNGPDTLGLGGNTTNRPDVVAHLQYPKTRLSWFNNTATTTASGLTVKGQFQQPLAPWAGGNITGYGNAGKDTIRGPGLQNWNISVYKNFPLTSHEGPRLEFRAESYNSFNHTEFNAVDSGFADGNFGQVTSAYDPRTFQFGIKLIF